MSQDVIRLLLIDDSQGDRLLAIRELKRAFPKIKIQEVGEADELTSALQTGEFDLVITDYQLRWSNGLVVLQTIKSRYPRCPVVMFTSSGSEEVAVQGMKQGLSDYVLKGKSLQRLSIAVQESLEKEKLRRDYENALEQLKHSEERFRQQAQELAEANQLKDEFLAVLSHELRTPLNPILGWAKLLRRGNLTPEKVDYALATIERNAELQTQLIEDLLDISRILRGKLTLNAQPVDLVRMISSAIETIRLAAEAKHIQIKVDLEPNGRFVSGDSGRLQQVLGNILSNAIKFTPEGGQVEVQLEQVRGEDAKRLESKRNDENASTPSSAYARITVRDTGKGIEPEFLPHIFDYFRQADSSTTRNFGGLGLGLAIARHLTELHGGTIQAESEGTGKGATFTITLPLMTARSEITGEIVPVEQAVNLQGITALVVDDEQDNLSLLTFILEEAGATVTAVTSAKQGLELLPHLKLDVLISDIGMPEMDGYTFIRQAQTLLTQSGKRILAIALTAYVGEANSKQALEAGFQMHLAKPVDPLELVKAITELVHPPDSSREG